MLSKKYHVSFKVLIFLLISVVILVAVATIASLVLLNDFPAFPKDNAEDIAKSNETVTKFLEEYPDAEVTVTHFEEIAFEGISDEIKSDCDNPLVQPKELYRVKIVDNATGLYVTVWIDWGTREIECIFKKGKEVAPPGDTCVAGWKCKDTTTKAYQNTDCSWKDETVCEFGCENGTCKPEPTDPCVGVSCGDYCSGNTRYYDGTCTDGQCSYSSLECEEGCENGMCAGSQDPCAGVTCSAKCVGNTRKYNGQCVNGQCTYSSEQCSHGCESGICQEEPDPCEGVSCPNTCDGNTLKYSGQCVNGTCQYSTQECQYGCESGQCSGEQDLCEGVTCPDTCEGNTRKYNGSCSNGQCQYSTIDCTVDYCEGSTRYYNGTCSGGQCSYSSEQCQYGCESGTCLSDPCEGITCNDYCDGGTAYYSGQCVAGECQYSSEECAILCSNGECITSGIIFITSQGWTGDLGGLDGADVKCNSVASAAGLPGTWAALLSDSFGFHAKYRIFDEVYRRMDGEIIANNRDDLFDGTIENPININENGVFTHGSVWTGSNSGGTSSGSDCDNWIYGTGWDFGGTIGSSMQTDSKWIEDISNSCLASMGLYCVLLSS